MPGVLHDFSQAIGLHYTVLHLPESILTLVGTDRDEIGARLAVIVTLQAD